MGRKRVERVGNGEIEEEFGYSEEEEEEKEDKTWTGNRREVENKSV